MTVECAALHPAAPAPPPADCPVCRASRPRSFHSIGGRDYWRCDSCGACFLDSRQRPSRPEELEHYLKHENDPHDRRYRQFLSRLADPLLARLPAHSHGLDYGCGPGLAAMLREAGHSIRLYDPFFFPDAAALEESYDFITCTETAEHFHRPAEEFDRLMALVRPGGRLAVMTSFLTDEKGFPEWRYRMDPTHVVFYRPRTFRRLAGTRGWSCEFPAENVAFLLRPDDAAGR